MPDKNKTAKRFAQFPAVLCLLAPLAHAAGLSIDSSGTGAGQAKPELWLELEGYRSTVVTPPAARNDLLEHLRQGFALTPEMNPRVEAELNWFLRHPDYLERVFTRAQRYLPHIYD
ncbi:MAG: hypothetical protein KDI09_07580, partial [Halioglobus sp.]|nr:hypothetical protein [Halioglobus sp.]